jgi:hypothetical protein
MMKMARTLTPLSIFVGFEVVRALENVKTDKRNDKPFEDVKIVNIEVNFDY